MNIYFIFIYRECKIFKCKIFKELNKKKTNFNNIRKKYETLNVDRSRFKRCPLPYEQDALSDLTIRPAYSFRFHLSLTHLRIIFYYLKSLIRMCIKQSVQNWFRMNNSIQSRDTQLVIVSDRKLLQNYVYFLRVKPKKFCLIRHWTQNLFCML